VNGIGTPELDAEVLLGFVLRVSREVLLAQADRLVDVSHRRRYRRLVARRAGHVPVAYLTSVREFYGLPIRVTPHVLIPRPETELLVERALAYLRTHPTTQEVIDLGTGSGAVAAAIAAAAPAARVQAIDRDPAALRVARRNALTLGLTKRIRFRCADLLVGAGRADLIAANLPYLSAARRRKLPPEVRREPRSALDGGPDGLSVIRRALAQAPHTLRSPGCLLLECDPGQAARLRRLAQRTWPNAAVSVIPDLAGRARVVEVRTC